MLIHSSTPWIVPSSPGRPCSMLSATSGLRPASTVATSGFTSTRDTRNPPRSSASAQALPERRLTSRSADQPPIRTATCFAMRTPPADGVSIPVNDLAKRRLTRHRGVAVRRLPFARRGDAVVEPGETFEHVVLGALRERLVGHVAGDVAGVERLPQEA